MIFASAFIIQLKNMKKLVAAISVVFIFIIYFTSANAELGNEHLYRKIEYTLNVASTSYQGVTEVSSYIPEKVCEYTAHGVIGNENTAESIFHYMKNDAFEIEKSENAQEYIYNYTAAPYHVRFLPAILQYSIYEGLPMRYDYANAFWVSSADNELYTELYVGNNLNVQNIPTINNSEFKERIREIYKILDIWGIETGNPYAIVYLNAATLQKNLDQFNHTFPDLSENYIWNEDEAILEIHIPTYLNGVKLKSNGIPGSPSAPNNCATYAVAYTTEKTVLQLTTTECLFDLVSEGKKQPLLSIDQVLKLYENYLNQFLFLPDSAENIRTIELEYNVWYKPRDGEFSHEYHLIPVWSVYTEHDTDLPTVMFDAISGAEL